jgi:hypothetical protein
LYLSRVIAGHCGQRETIIDFNDDRESFAEIRAVILPARELAQPARPGDRESRYPLTQQRRQSSRPLGLCRPNVHPERAHECHDAVLERRQVFAGESALQVHKGLRIVRTAKLQHGPQVGLYDAMDECRHVTAEVREVHG